MSEYLTLEDYMGDEEQEQVVNNAATQTTQDNRNRKIKPIKHPGLVLKTPIAYQPHTDLNFIPIRKDGIGRSTSSSIILNIIIGTIFCYILYNNFYVIFYLSTAVCEKCGAIGVKHAFYTKERRFCSRACARSSEHAAPTADSTYSPSHSVDQTTPMNNTESLNEAKPAKDDVSLIGLRIYQVESNYIDINC